MRNPEATTATVQITEVFQQGYLCLNFEEVKLSLRNEMAALIKRRAFEPVTLALLPKVSNFIPGRLMDAIKNPCTDDEKYKSRYVAGGHRDNVKSFLMHKLSKLRMCSLRTVVAIVSS